MRQRAVGQWTRSWNQRARPRMCVCACTCVCACVALQFRTALYIRAFNDSLSRNQMDKRTSDWLTSGFMIALDHGQSINHTYFPLDVEQSCTRNIVDHSERWRQKKGFFFSPLSLTPGCSTCARACSRWESSLLFLSYPLRRRHWG